MYEFVFVVLICLLLIHLILRKCKENNIQHFEQNNVVCQNKNIINAYFNGSTFSNYEIIYDNATYWLIMPASIYDVSDIVTYEKDFSTVWYDINNYFPEKITNYNPITILNTTYPYVYTIKLTNASDYYLQFIKFNTLYLKYEKNFINSVNKRNYVNQMNGIIEFTSNYFDVVKELTIYDIDRNIIGFLTYNKSIYVEHAKVLFDYTAYLSFSQNHYYIYSFDYNNDVYVIASSIKYSKQDFPIQTCPVNALLIKLPNKFNEFNYSNILKMIFSSEINHSLDSNNIYILPIISVFVFEMCIQLYNVSLTIPKKNENNITSDTKH